eukprot:583197_1
MMTFIFRYAYLLAVCLWGLQLFGMVSTAQLPDYNQGVNPSNVPSDLKEEDPPSLEYAENECAWGACPNSSNIPMPKLKRCKGCKSTYYCGKSCQKRHWNSRHRLNCSDENECAWEACPNSNNIPGPKLKRCKGCKATYYCGKRCKSTYYCGKSCQKRHWNSLHRLNCSEIQTNENLNEEKKEIPVGNEELYVEKKRNSSENEMEMENDGDQKSVEVKFNWRAFDSRREKRGTLHRFTCRRVSATGRVGDPNSIVSDPGSTRDWWSWTTKLNPGRYSCEIASFRGSRRIKLYGECYLDVPEKKLPVGRWVYVAEIRSRKNVQLSLKEILKT